MYFYSDKERHHVRNEKLHQYDNHRRILNRNCFRFQQTDKHISCNLNCEIKSNFKVVSVSFLFIYLSRNFSSSWRGRTLFYACQLAEKLFDKFYEKSCNCNIESVLGANMCLLCKTLRKSLLTLFLFSPCYLV